MSDRTKRAGGDAMPSDAIPSAADAEGIARLLAGVGPRPGLPPERAARIREAFAERLDREVRARRRGALTRLGRWAALAAAAAAAAGLLWWTGRPGPEPEAALATLVRAYGSVGGSLAAGSDPRRERVPELGGLALGQPLRRGDLLVTGATGRASLRLAGGTSVRVDSGSRLRLLAADRLALERGAVYVDSDPAAGAAGVLVRTALGTVREIGTQFEVRLQERGLRVRVREGRIVFEDAARRLTGEALEELRLDGDGGVERGAVARHDPGWRWTLDLAPPKRLEGLALPEFFAWLERETGRRVRFESPRLERAARRVVLHGLVDAASPESALPSVMAACDLGYRMVDGILWVEAIAPQAANGKSPSR